MSMFNDITKPAPPLPETVVKEISSELTLLQPLTRRGHGPGIIVLLPPQHDFSAIKEGVPSLPIKWAEEGYTVVGVSSLAKNAESTLQQALDALKACDKCEPKDKVGLVSYNPSLYDQAAPILASLPSIAAIALYADLSSKESIPGTPLPTLRHLAGPGEAPPVPERKGQSVTYNYTKAASHKFALPFQDEFNYGMEALSHTRNLQFLKPLMNGPYFDLETIWEEHTYYEFADRSVEHTMSTMVAEPYVNHVPTMTGGIGRGSLTSFYRQNFIFGNPPDTGMELLSRTLGIDRIIDEFVFSFTHVQEIDWILPGIPPTGKHVSVPFTAVVNVRGDRLYHEHITWDQGTVLAQLGLMPQYLPFPYPVEQKKEGVNGHTNGINGTNGTNDHHNGTNGHAVNGDAHIKKYEYRVPVAGVEVAKKMLDRNSVPSNEMFEWKIREVRG